MTSSSPSQGAPPNARDPMDPKRLADWELPDEDHVLERVRFHLHDQYFSGEEAFSTSRAPFWMSWQWGAGLAAAAVCAVVVWMGTMPGTAPLKMEYKGAIQKLASAKSSPQQPTKLSVSSQEKGEVSVPNKWQVVAQSDTSLTFSPASSQQHVKLHKGYIGVHVVPKQMKSFVVQVKNVNVVVKGTRFSVERTPQWLRVEVWRGRVEVQTAQDSRYSLPKGKGLRWSWKSMRAVEYDLPPKKSSLGSRWRWVARNQGVQSMVAYLDDMVESRRFSKLDKAEHLMDAANWARRKGALRTALNLKWRAYQLVPRGEGSDLRLFQAISSCQEALAAHAPRCASMMSTFQKAYPSASADWLTSIHFWQARANASQAKSVKSFRRHLLDFVRRYPKDGRVMKVRRWLSLSRQRSSVLLCREYRLSNPSSLPNDSWLFQRCKSK
ncbi:MAG: hypothetical protein EP343_29165 [Deltaproteobacteria bacterium]|nr:MAG: hypothetical protein EP343_29165 [Deltaproteobacteria bacterium]